MFQLSQEEARSLRFQIGMSKPGKGRGGRRYLPYAFTEHGVAMLSSALNSERAVAMNILIIRAFVKLREILARPSTSSFPPAVKGVRAMGKIPRKGFGPAPWAHRNPPGSARPSVPAPNSFRNSRRPRVARRHSTGILFDPSIPRLTRPSPIPHNGLDG